MPLRDVLELQQVHWVPGVLNESVPSRLLRRHGGAHLRTVARANARAHGIAHGIAHGGAHL